MVSRGRRTVADRVLARVPRRVRATTNPIGPGYAWVKGRFVDAANTAKRIFLPSTIDDNPSLSAEEYEESLAELPPIIRAKLRNGDWTAVEKGEFFDRDLIEVATPPRDMVKEVRFWDLAATPVSPRTHDPDWTCGVRLGVDGHGRWWLTGAELLREAPAGVEAAVPATTKLGGKDNYHRMFKAPAQAGQAQITNYARVLAGYDFAGVPISGNLMTLVMGISAQAGAGNLFMAPTLGRVAGEVFDQLEGFPYAPHDDVVAAQAAAVGGAHIGQGDMDPADVRAMLGPDKIVGVSCETKKAVRAGDPNIIDYLGIGTVFATDTKTDHEPAIGLDGLTQLCASTTLPTVAIGGLKARHGRDVLAAGADGMAVVSAICGQPDPRDAAATILQNMERKK